MKKNWKTIVIGILGGVLLGLNKTFELGIDETHINYITILAMSFFAKDYDTTGIGNDASKK